MNTPTTISKVKSGEFIRFKDSDTAPVWVRDSYDRSSKRYWVHKFDDVNHGMSVKASRQCFVGFTF